MNALKKLFYIALAAIFAAVFTVFPGCGKDDKSPTPSAKSGAGAGKEAKSQEKKLPKYKMDGLPADTILVMVNGRPITRGDYSAWLSLKSKAIVLSKNKKAQLTKEELAKARSDCRFRIHGELIRFECMADYAEKLGISPNAEQLEQSKKKVVALLGGPKATYEEVVAKVGERDGKLLTKLVRQDALDRICLAKSTTNDLTKVTDKELDERIEWVKKMNATAEAKNAEVRARAAKAKQEILDGAMFADVAKKYAEISPEDGVLWDTFELGELEMDDPLARWLVTAKQGDISDPMDYEEAIQIVGVRQMYEGEAPQGLVPQTQYELVRCAFHAYETIEEPEDREDFRKEMLAARREEAFMELGKKLMKSAEIEFPLGENIFMLQNKKPGAAKKKKAGKPAKAKAPAKPSGERQLESNQGKTPNSAEQGNAGKGEVK